MNRNFDLLVAILQPQGWSQQSEAGESVLISPSGEIRTYSRWVSREQIVDSRDCVFEKWENAKRFTSDDGTQRPIAEEWGQLARALDEVVDDGGLEHFFEFLRPTLESWAKSRNLTVRRYATACPRWIFNFRHPSGSAAFIEVRRIDRSRLSLHRNVRIRDTNKFIDYQWYFDGPILSRSSTNLVERLDDELMRVCDITSDDWSTAWAIEHFGEYVENTPQEMKHRMAEYEEGLSAFPRPTLP